MMIRYKTSVNEISMQHSIVARRGIKTTNFVSHNYLIDGKGLLFLLGALGLGSYFLVCSQTNLSPSVFLIGKQPNSSIFWFSIKNTLENRIVRGKSKKKLKCGQALTE